MPIGVRALDLAHQWSRSRRIVFGERRPYACIAVWEAHRTREEEAGLDWQSRITPAADLINKRLGIPALKHAMDLNGYYGGPPDSPGPRPPRPNKKKSSKPSPT